MIEDDEVIREVRAAREAFAASHGYSVRAMVMALRKLSDESGDPVVSFAGLQPEASSPMKNPTVSPLIGVPAPATAPSI